MRYSQIRNMDISNGIGIACSIFFQGCNHHCYNCFNQSTWSFDGGYEFTEDKQNIFFELCNKPHIDCISILGGEPFQQNLEELDIFLSKLQKLNKPIFVWSGYKYEELLKICPNTLRKIDYLIDGKFINELKDYKLLLRGSTNQRVIDVKKSFEQNKIILLTT